MLRKATAQDCGSVYDLICALEETRLPFDRFSSIFRRQAADPRYYCLVCEQGGRVIGVLNLRFEEQLHHARLIGEIMEFFIDAGHRDRGIGREMLDRACQIARDFGCAQLEVACNQLRTQAHRFYLREGLKSFHFKFSMPLGGDTPTDNQIGR